LIHELAHIKRADLWVNLAQSALQVVYFYNPLLWLANAIVRRVREQAVDEMVLVSLGNEPRDYSSTLVDIAELAFPRPSLGLQLIGVVESRKALAQRVKHIMTRPIPKTTRLGVIGLAAVAVVAAVLLPMARAKEPVPAATPVATKQTEQEDQQITGAQLMEGSMIVDGIMPAIKLAVEGKVGEERPRIPRIHSEPGPGVLHGIIIDRADTSRHLAALFFAPVEKWPGRALFWYLANVNQSFEITGIGEYHLFSVETSNPRNIDSVGLPVGWPRPVNIRADGEAAEVEIKVSSWLSKKARWWNMQGFLRGLGHLNAENVVTEQLGPYGRVTDSEGNPLPYAHIQVRGLEANGKDWEVVSSPDARTNQQGYYGVAPLDCPYFVGAIVHEPLKDAPGYRWRHLKRNRIFKGKQEINFQFAPWPAQLTGGGTIEGTVVDANGEAIPSFTTVLYCYCGCKSWRTFEGSVIDANGEAIPSFTVDVRGGEPFVWPHEANEPWSERWGLRAAFANGKFVIEDVPAGACNIRIKSHKSSSAGGATLATSQVTVAGGKTVQLTFEVEDWQTKRRYRPARTRSRRQGTAEEKPREPLPELKVGELAPAFEIQTVDGKKWALTDYRGKVVMLCFWQAGHQPTELQFPYFKSTYETFGADERFVMMSLVRKARRLKDLQQYATKYGLNWNHALMDEQVRQQLATAYGVQRWPSVILIGPDGKIIARNLKGNAMSWAVEKALKIQTASPK
jgi:peroxiredoxin